MKVVFNGIIEKRKSGCNCSGRKATSSLRMVTSKHYILPSGITKTFRVGQAEEVGEEDGQFLLQYMYTDKGERKHVFSEV